MVFDSNEPAPTNNKISLVPTSAVEKKECDMELDGTMLKKIVVGPKEINFGEIFKGSEKKQTFWCYNNLRYRIFVEFFFDVPEISQRYFIIFLINNQLVILNLWL